jgi:EAL domain-containing protein (putative c-di-GMP-specific phosphodiesterase class I)/anti-sigma regulatory factor (Ser/Thr protein kinase)
MRAGRLGIDVKTRSVTTDTERVSPGSAPDRRLRIRRLSDIRPPKPPNAASSGAPNPAHRSRRLALFAGLAFVLVVGLIGMLIYGWASDRGRADAQRESDRDVAALQGLVSGLIDYDQQQLSRERQAALEHAVAHARAEGSVTAVRLLTRDGAAVFSAGNPDAGNFSSLTPIGNPDSPSAVLEVERPATPSGSTGGDTYLLIAALTLLLFLAAVTVFSRGIRSLTAGSGGRRHVVRAIRRGIEHGEFELHYQPQIDIVTGRPVAVEALLRWRRRGNLIPPGDFLADAEASGVIGPLTDHVVELALEQAARWRQAGRELRLSVNLSAVNLRDFGIVEHLKAMLERYDVAPDSITFEVTETAVLDEPEQTRAVLDAIAELGFPIAVDDFGTGYSSMLWLRLFPVTEVKIDRTFVSAMSAEGEAYVAGVVRLGHDLDLTVVAEGIEDHETLVVLQELGCDLGQGFLFAKALPPSELERWLATADADNWASESKELCMNAEEVDLDAARQLIEETATTLGFDDSAIWDMKCAATEALTNALEHGTPSDDGLIHLRLGRDHGDMLVEVWGGGKPKGAPHVDAAHRGRGIAIMTALMDDVEMLRNDGDTVVRLTKRLPERLPTGV